MRVFLGGTCNESTWREGLIKALKIGYFNPVVDDWTPDCMAEEIKQREECDFCLYVITPKMTGVYSIAEVVDDSHKKKGKTLFCLLEIDEFYAFTPVQLKSLIAVKELLERNNVITFTSLDDVAEFLNKQALNIIIPE